jgi:hypothetical protein
MRRSVIVTCSLLAVAAGVAQPDLRDVLRDRALRLRTIVQKAQLPFASPERFNWHYVPRPRRGVPLQDLTPEQKTSLDQLLRAGLSEGGFTKAKGVIELESILGRVEGSDLRDPGQYFFTLFGDYRDLTFDGHRP